MTILDAGGAATMRLESLLDEDRLKEGWETACSGDVTAAAEGSTAIGKLAVLELRGEEVEVAVVASSSDGATMLVLQQGCDTGLIELAADVVSEGLIAAASAALLEQPMSAILDARLQLPALPLGFRLDSVGDHCGNLYYSDASEGMGGVLVRRAAGDGWSLIWNAEQMQKVHLPCTSLYL